MKFLLAALLVLLATPAAVAQTPDPLSYDDPAMHFRPPDGWTRLDIQMQENSSGMKPVAAYLLRKSKTDQRVITISVQPFDGSLEGFERSHESDLRNSQEGTFIDRHEQTKLSNGMPVYFIRVNTGTGSLGATRSYQYIAIDTARGIVVSYGGRLGDFDEKDAKEALSSLYIVVYPRRR